MHDQCWWCHRLIIFEPPHHVAPFTLDDPAFCDNPNSGGTHESTNDIVEASERYSAAMRRDPRAHS